MAVHANEEAKHQEEAVVANGLNVRIAKIDRSFIANLGVDRDADAVVTAIVRLARALNLSVIA